MENVEKKKNHIFTFALFFVCAIFTLSATFTFAYFFNKRGETARYLVGQVKVDMDLGEYNYETDFEDKNITQIRQPDGAIITFKQVLPNMPIFRAAKVSVAREHYMENGVEKLGDYIARACYVRVRFTLEILNEDDTTPTLTSDQEAYIQKVKEKLAECEIYTNSAYSWNYDTSDGCYYLVKADDEDTMYELRTDGAVITGTDYELDTGHTALTGDIGFRQGSFAYLTRDSFSYPIVGNFDGGVTYKDPTTGQTRYYKIKIVLGSEAIQSEYLSDALGNSITSKSAVKELMDARFGS